MAFDRAKREALIQQFADGPARLRAALAAVPPAALKWRPAPKEWSAHEVVVHCADSETNSFARIRFLVAETAPTIQGYDEAKWATTFGYHDLPLEPALAVVDAVRANTAHLLRRLPAEAFAKTGRHTEVGAYSVEKWLTYYAEHLHVHAAQIDRNVAAFAAQRR